jgi:hypothetical protein
LIIEDILKYGPDVHTHLEAGDTENIQLPVDWLKEISLVGRFLIFLFAVIVNKISLRYPRNKCSNCWSSKIN